MPSSDPVVRFGVFELDLRARHLTKRGKRVHLQDKPFETLVLLLDRFGAIVTREELRQHLWPANTFVIFDDSLNTAVRKLREALGDSADNPRFIETIPRRGYRFIGPIEHEASVKPVDQLQERASPPDVRTEDEGATLGVAARIRLGGAWVALVPATMAVGFFVWQAWRPPDRGEPPRTIPLTALPGAELYPSLSPDGTHAAYTWMGPKQDSPDVYVQMIGSGSPLRLTTTSRNEFNPVWSPDGRWIAFLRAERSPPVSAPAGIAELWLIPALGGPERQLAEIWLRTIVGSPGFLAWCPDSTCLVVTDSPGQGQPDALFVVSMETGEKRQLTRPQHPLLGDCNPSVSPDGRSLVFRRVPAARAGELYWFPLGKGVTVGGEPTRLTLGQLNGEYPAWMPDSKEILFSARGRLWRLAVSGHKPSGTPAQLPFVGDDGSMPAVSRPPPGRPTRLVYVRSFNDSNIWRLETSAPGARSSSPPVVAISSTTPDINPDFSPDTRRVAFASRRSGSMEIWLADADGANAVQLTSLDAQTTTPRWSRDGRLIAFQSNHEGQFEIYVIPDAGGRPRNLTSHPANDHVPSFSRDDQWVYFSSNRSGDYRIWKVPVGGGDAVQVTNDAGFRAVEGRDGRYIYYSQIPGEPAALWRMPTVGGQAIKLLDGVVTDAFAIVEKGIYFVDRHGNETRLQYYDFATRESTTVARRLGDIIPLLTASPDGRTILFSRIDSSVQDLILVENIR